MALVLPFVILSFWGCASVISGTRIAPEDVDFIKPGSTTRATIIENLGPPLYDLKEERGIAYVWVTAGHSGYYFGPRYQNQSLSNVKERAFCIAFDEADRVTGCRFLDAADSDSLREKMVEWLKTRQVRKP